MNNVPLNHSSFSSLFLSHPCLLLPFFCSSLVFPLFHSCFFLFTRAFYLHSLPSPCLRFLVCHMWCHLQWWWVWGDESQFPSSFSPFPFKLHSLSPSLSLSPLPPFFIVKIKLKSCSFVNLYSHQKMSGLEKRGIIGIFLWERWREWKRGRMRGKSLSKT